MAPDIFSQINLVVADPIRVLYWLFARHKQNLFPLRVHWTLGHELQISQSKQFQTGLVIKKALTRRAPAKFSLFLFPLGLLK